MKIPHFQVSTIAVIFPLILGLTFSSVISPLGIGNIEGGTSSDKTTAVNSDPIKITETVQNELTIPNDPFYSRQWALDKMVAPNLWGITSAHPEILIAILDTGIDRNHEDLIGKVVAEVNFTDSPSVNDINGHGTHVAGIIAAINDNGIGITGLVPSCRLLNVKVANDYGFCDSESVARSIIWAVDNGAKIINISLEIRYPSLTLEEAVNYAWNHDVIIVAAAGNQGNKNAVYPAYYENCIAVAASQPDGTLAPLSNYGDWVDVAGPGLNIFSTLPGNLYGYETGTSFATAYITGLAAIFSYTVNDTNGNSHINDEIRCAIERSFSNETILSKFKIE
jgi:thermitase